VFFLLLTLLLSYNLPLQSACSTPFPAMNLWQLTDIVYCMTSKIDGEINTLTASSIDLIVSETAQLISNLEIANSELELIISDVNTISSQLDTILNDITVIEALESAILVGTCSCIATATQSLSLFDVILKSDIDSVSTKADSIGSQVSQLQNSSNACCSSLSVLDVIIKSDVDSVSTKTDSIGSQVSQLTGSSNACCNTIGSKVDSVGSQVSQVKSDLDACCATLSTLDVIIKSDVDSVSTKTDSIGSQVSQTRSDLDACCSSLSVMDTLIKSDVDSVSTKTDSIGSQVSQVKSDLDSCCATLSTLDTIIKSDVDSVSSTLNDLVYCTIGTQITQAMIPYTISAPGHYYLCSSVTTSAGGVTINIASNDVYLNLNGFTVANTANAALFSFSGVTNVTIENGSVSGALGIELDGLANVTLRNLDISSSAGTGCFLGAITNLVMEDCYVTANGAALVCVSLSSIVGGRLENVSVYNTAATGFFIQSTAASTVVELINCVAENIGGDAFSLQTNSGGVVLRDCVVITANRGFLTYADTAPYVLENCVATNCSLAGFWMESVSDVVLRGCIAKNSGSGFRARVATGLLFEECVAQDNSANGFSLDASIGANIGCVFNYCLSMNNGGEGFFISSNAHTRILHSIASGNAGSGIFDSVGSIDTYIVDSRSQYTSTLMNPAYNLNTALDVLFPGVDTVIITS